MVSHGLIAVIHHHIFRFVWSQKESNFHLMCSQKEPYFHSACPQKMGFTWADSKSSASRLVSHRLIAVVHHHIFRFVCHQKESNLRLMCCQKEHISVQCALKRWVWHGLMLLFLFFLVRHGLMLIATLLFLVGGHPQTGETRNVN